MNRYLLLSIGLAVLASSIQGQTPPDQKDGLTFNSPRLLVNDFKKSLHFYKEVLGLPVVFAGKDGHYAEVGNAISTIAIFDQKFMPLHEQASGNAKQGDRSLLVFAAPDTDKWYRTLLQKGVHFVSAPEDKPTWGIRIALFRDPDGNLIEINSPLPRLQKK